MFAHDSWVTIGWVVSRTHSPVIPRPDWVDFPMQLFDPVAAVAKPTKLPAVRHYWWHDCIWQVVSDSLAVSIPFLCIVKNVQETIFQVDFLATACFRSHLPGFQRVQTTLQRSLAPLSRFWRKTILSWSLQCQVPTGCSKEGPLTKFSETRTLQRVVSARIKETETGSFNPDTSQYQASVGLWQRDSSVFLGMRPQCSVFFPLV